MILVAQTSPPPSPPPAIVQIAQRVQSQEQGSVVYQLTRNFQVHAGPMHRTDQMEMLIASSDGKTVKARIVTDVIGGKAASAQTIAQTENQYEHPKPGDLFHRPFDPRYLNEYTYQQVDSVTWKFTTLVKSSGTGDGTFTLDSAGNVVKYQYSPAVLPQYTSRGTVSDVRSQVLPNYWAVTQETQQYGGHYAIFGGGANVMIDYTQYRHYPDIAAAVAAVNHQ